MIDYKHNVVNPCFLEETNRIFKNILPSNSNHGLTAGFNKRTQSVTSISRKNNCFHDITFVNIFFGFLRIEHQTSCHFSLPQYRQLNAPIPGLHSYFLYPQLMRPPQVSVEQLYGFDLENPSYEALLIFFQN